ncbi:alpha/beta hydrolase [Aeromonas taiwanensis]|uniref:alpha/beta hydrolase n=1 Tax=Aeromonas taiwanensis TaxID=633417 RepID=UPI003F744C91
MSNVLNLTYQNLGWQTAADLYQPPDFDEQKRYPAIVSTHPIGSCKEQTAGNVYAKGLAAAGFVVLVHDASFQGASGGEPRFIEDPAIRVSDIRFAVDYLQSLSYVDSERIGAIGVCGGGAYTIHAGITDHRLKALASITGVNYGRLIREGFAQFKPLELAQGIARMRTAQEQGDATEPADLLPRRLHRQAHCRGRRLVPLRPLRQSRAGGHRRGKRGALLPAHPVILRWGHPHPFKRQGKPICETY